MTSSIEWIRLECLPLPDSFVEPCVVFWNPFSQEIVGEAAGQILKWVEDAMEKGYLNSPTLSHFEIVNPLTRPSELAAILAQYYWVIPQPVLSPDRVGESENFVPILH